MPLRPLGPGLWDSLVHMRTMGPLRVPRRMSVIRLAAGGLLLHSPNPLGPELRRALAALGPVRCLVAPSLMHTAFLADYRAAYPEALLYAAPGLRDAHPELRVDAVLEDASCAGGEPAPWAGEVEHLLTEGVPRLNEVAFLHRASRTLLLTDYAHNVDASSPWLTRCVFRAIRGYGRLGPTRYFRGMVRDPAAVWRSVERICAWDFAQVQVCHGALSQAGPAELLAAFRAYAPA